MSGGRWESDSRGDYCNGYEMIRASIVSYIAGRKITMVS